MQQILIEINKQIFAQISAVDLSYVVTVKSTVVISQNFVAFSKNLNFKSRNAPSERIVWPVVILLYSTAVVAHFPKLPKEV